MRRTRGCAPVVLLACVLGGCGTTQWIARDQFGSKYSCTSDLVTVRKEIDATTPQGQPMPGYTELYVGGCGTVSRYLCHSGASGGVCAERLLFAIQATDGSVYTAMNDDPRGPEVALEAALVSAVHDIPCARASLHVIAREPTVVEGCGQQVTYQEQDHDLQPPPGYKLEGQMKGFVEVMVARTAAPAPGTTP